MDKISLAKELKNRQYKLGLAKIIDIDSLTDDQIIDCYITCSCCEEKLVNNKQLQAAIAAANNSQEFLEIINKEKLN